MQIEAEHGRPVAMMLHTEAQQIQDHAHGVGANVLAFAFSFLLLLELLLLLTAGARPRPLLFACCLHHRATRLTDYTNTLPLMQT